MATKERIALVEELNNAIRHRMRTYCDNFSTKQEKADADKRLSNANLELNIFDQETRSNKNDKADT